MHLIPDVVLSLSLLTHFQDEDQEGGFSVEYLFLEKALLSLEGLPHVLQQVHYAYCQQSIKHCKLYQGIKTFTLLSITI